MIVSNKVKVEAIRQRLAAIVPEIAKLTEEYQELTTALEVYEKYNQPEEPKVGLKTACGPEIPAGLKMLSESGSQ